MNSGVQSAGQLCIQPIGTQGVGKSITLMGATWFNPPTLKKKKKLVLIQLYA